MSSKIEVSKEVVKSIKELYENTKTGYKKISKILGLPEGTVHRIIKENEFKKTIIHPIDALSKEYLEDLYIKQKKTLQEISEITGVRRLTLGKRIKEFGIQIRHPGFEPYNITKEELVELYINQGLTQKQIADRYGCAISVLTKLFKKYKIKIRKKGVPSTTLEHLFTDKKLSVSEIASKLGYKESTILNRLKDMGLIERDKRRTLNSDELIQMVTSGSSMKEMRCYFKCSVTTIQRELKRIGIEPSKGALDTVPREVFYRLFIIEGKTLKEVGGLYHVSEHTIKRRLRDLKFNIITEKAKHLKEILPKEKLEELYLEKKISQDDIAKQYHVGRSNIHKLIEEYKIQKDDPYAAANKETLEELYVRQNLPPCIISEKIGVPSEVIRRRVINMNLRKLKTEKEIISCKNKAYEVTLKQVRSRGEKEISELFPTPYHNIHSIINLELDL